MFYAFPKDFWWGAASSGPQSEGHTANKAPSIWDYWYQKQPTRFFQGVGPQLCSDFYHRYAEDIGLMKQFGLNTFRTSIQWSRLIPNGVGPVDPEAARFYHAVIDEQIQQGITPFLCLHHFDMPMSMQDKGGWENREVIDAYIAYAQQCFTLFGEKVRHWFTFNEPIVPVEGGYLYDFEYPNVIDFQRAVQVAYHTLLASAKAVRLYHERFGQGQIGIILNLSPTYPRSTTYPGDVEAARVADLLFTRSFLDPVLRGAFAEELIAWLSQHGLMPQSQADDTAIFAQGVVDLLGVNYYMPRRVKVQAHMIRSDLPVLPEYFFEPYVMPGRKFNPYRGWEIYEKGVYDILHNLRVEYGNIPCFISENGMGVEDEARFRGADGIIADDYRIAFLKDHLSWIHRALSEGSNVRGYHMWSFTDTWSWINAYKNRYGFIEVDLQDNTRRRPKKSAEWYRQVIQNQGFEAPEIRAQ